MRGDVQKLIDVRKCPWLTRESVPDLTGGIRAVVGFGPDIRSAEVKRRYDRVLSIANQHLPPGACPIETWQYADNGPGRVLQNNLNWDAPASIGETLLTSENCLSK